MSRTATDGLGRRSGGRRVPVFPGNDHDIVDATSPLSQRPPPRKEFKDMSSSKQQLLDKIRVFIRTRMSTILTLLMGIIIGLAIAEMIFHIHGGNEFNVSDSLSLQHHRNGLSYFRSSHHRLSSASHSKDDMVNLPSLEKRERVLRLLGTLTGYHARECTRRAQKAYRRQVYQRYQPLVGFENHRGPTKAMSFYNRVHRWLSGESSPQTEESSQEVEQIFANSRPHDGHTYFFAINLYNSFDVIPDLFSTMFKVSSILGLQNVFVSVYENGSSDQTKALLRLFDSLCRAAGLRVVIRTSARKRGAFNHRIEYLAEVRNAALAPLHEMRERDGEVFDTIVFMNDVLPCVDDLLELIWQSRHQNAGVTCGTDYEYHDELRSPVFYDNWVSRDINGTALNNEPFERVFVHPESSYRFQHFLPIQVQSCWNGIAVLDPAPLYMHPFVKFRMAHLGSGECSASECSLVCNDYWDSGYGRIIMVPRVKLAYRPSVYKIIHPERRNLTSIRNYVRFGGNPDDPASDPQDRSWFGPHDRLFHPAESEIINFKQSPPYVWCWGWDGAGDLDGPDVDPVWEPRIVPNPDPVKVRHDRSFAM